MWEREEVIEAAARIIESKPEIEIRLEIELKFKIGDTYVTGFLPDSGDKIHTHPSETGMHWTLKALPSSIKASRR
ncbi:DUF3898 domain-containing protein [Paenibacillus sp. HN-1]|uniref:DUF3898 domain-containing protein n=1 Tax=Paenibacillus TaxID=44249 RepID=UPI001CA90062|nr:MULTISPECIES: DUF3898 domain-containing protein [Paenibacillus]MBY9079242.1 DUF3898 domain-containing protein [Paenibacillus sp. CGMCC 1.18879]MBY9086965.1 DUF3898 domain-containing protein [Paenibacillus sinensis]